ncbi:glycerol-3-phosphate dehydrogenase [Candidatus Aerophobetes bacterium]|uniref:Glycerol-3-phosphate dehydrogenase [NAD(P)+] n=1 Tax=Aerophobetes bacterium TaxID=2030807 RepID=A0A2A4X450_UNCAE|nr:MAG: glycerol-3-phosphate dehydrogenase [Candidatus Aerophobetes bacterium]
MKIGYLGAGAWGFTLAYLLAQKGYSVKLWSANHKLIETLKSGKKHPKLPSCEPAKTLEFTTDLAYAIEDVDLVIESVTSKGIRPVLSQIKQLGKDLPNFVITSKGIEQKSLLLLSEVAIDVLGDSFKDKVGCLSGPSLANEVMNKLPSSVVCAAYNHDLMMLIAEAFSNNFFRVYPNSDVPGVSFGGAMKNVIAIACAISDGLGFGQNTKSALMTRGLHEIRKLSASKGANPETLNGLGGLGDLIATCLSPLSRNYEFGRLLSMGLTPQQAQEKVGMVVEGAYSCVSALELSKKMGIDVPITKVVYKIIYEGLDMKEAVESLLSRKIKKEHL